MDTLTTLFTVIVIWYTGDLAQSCTLLLGCIGFIDFGSCIIWKPVKVLWMFIETCFTINSFSVLVLGHVLSILIAKHFFFHQFYLSGKYQFLKVEYSRVHPLIFTPQYLDFNLLLRTCFLRGRHYRKSLS